MSLHDDLLARVSISATLVDGDKTFRASASGGPGVAGDLANKVVAEAIELRRIRKEGGTWDALRIRCHPALEEAARARWRAQQWEFDATMKPDRVEVTPFAYAEDIQMEIGFVEKAGEAEAGLSGGFAKGPRKKGPPS